MTTAMELFFFYFSHLAAMQLGLVAGSWPPIRAAGLGGGMYVMWACRYNLTGHRHSTSPSLDSRALAQLFRAFFLILLWNKNLKKDTTEEQAAAYVRTRRQIMKCSSCCCYFRRVQQNRAIWIANVLWLKCTILTICGISYHRLPSSSSSWWWFHLLLLLLLLLYYKQTKVQQPASFIYICLSLSLFFFFFCL